MILARIDRQTWLERFAKDAHMSVFGYECPDYDNTMFDYAILVLDVSDKPLSYVLVKEMKKHSFYIEYGGSFPEFRASTKVPKSFYFILDEMKKLGFKECTLMTHVDNVPMQKLALFCGFRVFGVTQGSHGLCLEYRVNLIKEESK